MLLTFETLGNATIQFAVDGEPILATDPWLVGTCYFGSWALDHALTPQQIANVQKSPFIWISHGHPDHLHHESLKLIPKDKTILLPDHYDHDIADFLTDQGFSVEILGYRTWRRIHPQIEVMCLDNENQDAILIVRFGDALVLNINDSPWFGENVFLRNLVRKHPNDRVYLLQLCSIDADMRNFVDEHGRRTIGAPDELKLGAIWEVARGAEALGAKYFCCSSSQHIYVRADSVWANPYRITFEDVQQNWSRPAVTLVPPFVTMDVATGRYAENHPSHTSDESQITARTGEDDWSEQLSSIEWQQVEAFFKRFRLLRRYIDFIAVTVGGETRRFSTNPWSRADTPNPSGITFVVPRRSLLDVVTYGYFDDLLIGNFMRTQLQGTAALYPFVTPIIAKLGGNAKVFDTRQHARFLWRYFRRNPWVFLRWRFERTIKFGVVPTVREWALRLGLFRHLKQVYRGWILKDPFESAIGAKAPATSASRSPYDLTPRIGAGTSLDLPMVHGKWVPHRPDFSHYDRPRLIISVDTEEDFDWSAPFSSGSRSVHSMSRQHLAQRVLERHGVKPIYLCDFPIADQEAAYGVLREWSEAGRCALGTQLHPWVNPPLIELVNERNSYPCNLPFSLQHEKLRVLTERFVETLGVRPTVYKAGRHGADANLGKLLKPLGYKVDMSFNPIRSYRSKGGPNHTLFPHTPFWLNSEHDLLSIPLTANVMGTLRRDWLKVADLVWSETAERLKLGAILRSLNVVNRVALTPEGVPLNEAKQLTRFLIRNGHRVFSLSYHSTSLTPGSTPYVRSENDLTAFLGWLDAYLEFFIGELNGISALPIEVYQDACSAPVMFEPAA